MTQVYLLTMNIDGYNLVCSAHPSNTKRGRACTYYRSSLPLRVLNINYSSKGIVFNIKLGSKICSFLVLYRPSSQSSDEFESFSKNLKPAIDHLMQNTPYMMVLCGDF